MHYYKDRLYLSHPIHPPPPPPPPRSFFPPLSLSLLAVRSQIFQVYPAAAPSGCGRRRSPGVGQIYDVSSQGRGPCDNQEVPSTSGAASGGTAVLLHSHVRDSTSIEISIDIGQNQVLEKKKEANFCCKTD